MPECLLFLLIYILFLPVVIYYNHVHRQKYYELMAYLRYHHPEIASQIELKRVLGFLYPSGAFRPSIRYARDHEPLDDPVAEELLADYARLSSRVAWIALAMFVLGILVVIAGFKQLDVWLSP